MSENLKAMLDDDGSVTTTGPYATHVFTFDHVYDQASTQKKVRLKMILLSRTKILFSTVRPCR